MHWIDAVSARALARTPPQRRLFRRGWGDPEALEAYLAEATTLSAIPEIPIRRGRDIRHDSLTWCDLSFESPGRFLPEPTRLARARWLRASQDGERLVILMAAWNGHGYTGRLPLARALAARGISSVMLEQPFYGERRPHPDEHQPLATVADFMWMGRAAVLEGRVLADHFRRRGHTVGVAGFSMGGNMAGYLAGSMPFPVAPALLGAPCSPAPVFLNGILRSTIDWEALGGSNAQTRRRLGDILRTADVVRFPAPAHTRAAVLVGATRDGYIPTSAVQAIHRHWPGSHLEWVHGGHAALLWFHRALLVESVVRSFDRLRGK